MVNTYQLVNPQIEGKFKSKIKATNSKEAANLFYKNISEHFNNSVPQFYFSIQKGSSGDGKHYHFKVNEKRTDNQVNFSVKSISLKNEEVSLTKFKNKLDNFKAKQNGGKHRHKHHKKDDEDESSSSSSSESDSSDSEYLYKRSKKYVSVTSPFNYWWYDPYLYNMSSVYIPTFYSYLTPYVQIALL